MRFIRRDGPRIFLDSRDLIGVVEHGKPLAVRGFAEKLASQNGRVVLTYTNVVETLPRTRDGRIERARALDLVAKMELLPVAYLRQPDLYRREFRNALEAYETGQRVRPVDPYVDEWWETFSKTPSEFVAHVKPSIFGAVHGSTLVQQVEYLLASGDDLLLSSEQVGLVANAMQDDRSLHGAKRGVEATWVSAVEKQFLRFGWDTPRDGIMAFAEFLAANVDACPGWRLGVALYEEFRSNLNATIRAGDIPDFSHAHFLPYVTHATLDGAWRDRCERARHRLSKTGSPVAALDRVYPDLAAILTKL